MRRGQAPYPPEFREEAVRLVRDGGKSIGQTVLRLSPLHGLGPERCHNSGTT